LATLIALILTCAPSLVTGQDVLLQIHPHTGDTLHMRLDQEMDLGGDLPQTGGDPWSTTTTTWCVLQRMVVERADSGGVDVLQVTDSMAVATSVPRTTAGRTTPTPTPPAGGHPALEGTSVLLHIAPDGAVTVLDSTDRVGRTLRQVVADLPVTFPRQPVRVGSSWVRTMKVPAGADYGAGQIRLEFRLDSVTPSLDSAFVSVRGPLGKEHNEAVVGGATVTTRGILTGTMVIDRRRGWLTDWHALISVQSVMHPPKGSDAEAGRMHMTLMQWLRAVDRP
jgi:hypothetical protein